MTIFENLEQIYNHLESNEQIELAERLLLKRKLELGLIEREKMIIDCNCPKEKTVQDTHYHSECQTLV